MAKNTVQSVEPNIADLVNGWLKSYDCFLLERCKYKGFFRPDKIKQSYHIAKGRLVKTTRPFCVESSEGGRNFLKNKYKIFKLIFVQNYRKIGG